MNFPFSIALCCNGSLLPGLHATLGSLTQRLGQRDKVALTVFISDIDPADQDALRQTVVEAGGVGDLQIREVDLSDFKDLRTLHGDRTTYLRLKLPDLLPGAPTILYLDSDLVVHTDVSAIFAVPLGGALVGAVMSDMVQWNPDRDVYLKLGLADGDFAFNPGVLLIDAAAWRQNGTVERALEFAQTHAAHLKSHDQTVLNALFAKSFYDLPKNFNEMLVTSTPRLEAKDTIYHFMGSPKPWDPLGTVLHRNAHLWSDAIATTRFRWPDFLRRHGTSYALRTWALRRSYVRVTLRRMRWFFWRRFFEKRR